jgi:hypothetical protein
LPASTTTIFKTQTGKAVTSSTTLPAAVATKTTTVKSVSTVWQTATKTKVGGAVCTT